MKTITTPFLKASVLPNENTYATVSNYYDIAGPDYEVWNADYNMHFGYARSFGDIFSLKKMLTNMSREVIEKLEIQAEKKTQIVDLGCGVGTVARFVAKQFPLSTITAVTISAQQVKKAVELIQKENATKQVTVICENFESLSFKSGSFTHAYALESACHANGKSKELFIAEMARVLKAGGRFCIADGFLKPVNKRPAFFRYLYKRVAKYWAVPSFASITEFEQCLKEQGLENIQIKEISHRIAPSVLYVPWTCLKFFIREIRKNHSLRMQKERWYNVYAPVLGMIMGLYRKQFGYFIITGNKA